MATTIKTTIEELFGEVPAKCPIWPPDAFATAARVFFLSGAYTHVLSLSESCLEDNWVENVHRWAEEWRDSWGGYNVTGLVPAEIESCWQRIAANGEVELERIRDNVSLFVRWPGFCVPLITLVRAWELANVHPHRWRGS